MLRISNMPKNLLKTLLKQKINSKMRENNGREK